MELAHHRAGAGEPLVLVHGTGSQWQAFRPVLEPLAARRDVIALDLPGFGASPPFPAAAPHTPRAFAEAVAGLLDGLGLRDAHVAGFSLGGGIAYELGRLGRARSVTAISPIGFWTAREVAYCRASLRVIRGMARAMLPAAPALLGTAVGRTLLESQLVGRPWRMNAEDAVQATRNLVLSPGFEPEVRDSHVAGYQWTERLGVPVTIAWGTRDSSPARPRAPGHGGPRHAVSASPAAATSRSSTTRRYSHA